MLRHATILAVALTIPFAQQSASAQDETSNPKTFKYQVLEQDKSVRGGGELRIGATDKVSLDFGGNTAEVSSGGQRVGLTMKSSADVSLLSSGGAVAKEIAIKEDGAAVIQSYTSSGSKVFRITDGADGSGTVEIFSSDRVRYVITISANGELSFKTTGDLIAKAPAATKPAVATKPATTTKTATPPPQSTTPDPNAPPAPPITIPAPTNF